VLIAAIIVALPSFTRAARKKIAEEFALGLKSENENFDASMFLDAVEQNSR
jgi:hypothetical protein